MGKKYIIYVQSVDARSDKEKRGENKIRWKNA
ncbi:MAG: hypothetical protein ACI9YB_002592 [Halioglobus sp.]|jgi:hypothetical protein